MRSRRYTAFGINEERIMQITFSPQLRHDALTLSVSGSVLTVNDTPFDLSVYDPEANPCDWIVGEASAEAVTIILPIGPDATEAARFPEPVTVTDGAVTLPA